MNGAALFHCIKQGYILQQQGSFLLIISKRNNRVIDAV